MKFVIASKHKLQRDMIASRTWSDWDFGQDLELYGENTESLPVIYNRALEKHLREKNIDPIIFLHDDVYINTTYGGFKKALYTFFERYAVLGVAGTQDATFKEPALWHLMARHRESLHGCVAHGSPEKYQYTSFGSIPNQALLIDGVFIAINPLKIGSVRFDENIPSKFHFYDLCFSMDCNLAKLKVGVVDIPIIHASPGLKEVTADWKAGEAYFLNKYSQFKNQTVTV